MSGSHSWEETYNTEETQWLDEFGMRAYANYRRWIGVGDRRVLDAGFGSGRFCLALARDLAETQVYGIDISDELVLRAGETARRFGLQNASFSRGDILDLDFPDDYFDVVFNEGVIEHLPEYEQAVAEMVRVTRPGGRVVVGVPNWYCWPHTVIKRFMGDDYDYGFELSFTQRRLKDLFRGQGLGRLEMAGYLPMWAFKRHKGAGIFAGSLKTVPLRLAARTADPVERMVIAPIDAMTSGAVSRRFGFEIVIKGEKVEP